MSGDQTPEAEKRETLLFAIQHRVQHGQRPLLRPSEAALLLNWALTSEEAQEQAELLHLFRRLGGLEIVEAALSDFD